MLESKLLCVGPLGKHLGFYCSRLLQLPDGQSPCYFYRQILCGLHFLALVIWVWGPIMRFRPWAPQEGFLQLIYYLQLLTTSYGVSPLFVSALPTSPYVASFINPFI